jgi:hypothetical protein
MHDLPIQNRPLRRRCPSRHVNLSAPATFVIKSKKGPRKMASRSSSRNGYKLKPSRTAQAKRRTRAPKAVPLNALRDATRKAELQRKPRRNKSEPRLGNDGTPVSPGLDVVGLMNRRARALLELPTRIARCHSPFELWREQARYMQEIFTDYQSVAQHMMTNPLRSFPRSRPESAHNV